MHVFLGGQCKDKCIVNIKLQQLWGNFKSNPRSVSTFLDNVIETKVFSLGFNSAYNNEDGYPFKEQEMDEKEFNNDLDEGMEEADQDVYSSGKMFNTFFYSPKLLFDEIDQ